ncbi:site-specific integrase [Leuconostoc gasicomitatum]|uniref:site-specific integrase n=1 Tax=Leuconostoc gasicomitatum TaxID=115778 RepID=UPI001CC6DBD2|nr:site-specific integrase [Leuconostoc gasicomitatum]MBZ5958181.1 site-specific integrase [Leuconostoc gasicomitatum]
MASIYKRGTSWTASVSINKDRIYKKKTKSGFRTKTDANKWAIETESQKINDTLSKGNGIIAEMFDDWYEVFKEPVLETKSKAWYKVISKLLREEWPNKRISDISTADFQKLINNYGKTHVKSSVSHINNIISSFVRYAVDEDFIYKDFSRNVKTFSAKSSKDKDLKFLENNELELLVKDASNSEALTSHMILMAIYSGARYSEIAGLTKHDFDFENNTISINKSWQAEDREFKATKTKTSNRVVDLPPDFMTVVKKWTFGKQYAFESITGLPPTNNAVNKQLKRYLEKRNSKLITFHGLRHTHASYLLSKDIAIQYVSERLGHADVNITLSTYAHLLERKRTAETNKTLNILKNL